MNVGTLFLEKFFYSLLYRILITTRTHENNTILSLFQNLKCRISHKKTNDFKLDNFLRIPVSL
ncbi:hypothetical protein A6J42_13745 [Leptospira interrogans serovar Copenhageni]|uniref:Uncharacterized protein n=1 Tax=Leptospira interrogans serovar Copenhageni str. LT2050 TaxID=1001598 RepID=M3HEQ3_LEPIT|nr:hypothetical protein A6J42_13745 [Leptospira interrogans serovar Copenhageni]ASP41202.1 hypothetical protein AMR47_02080 [Leptospira interrogans]EMG22824.1 hypothetical protein LEP1GSC150_4577 [Leptospira interrogans serovar Copenhageni str. LT2050]EMJ72792.1 hypothetical protein LEP1GSC033_1490 [Leptospira interrogans str. 2002000632]OOB94376.1 hypothetical protein B0191_13455 [Leptospira interrogans serovar Hardjo]OOC00075.1 hypothetical protein B0192_02475 [Leptospira interrogans serovar